MEVLVETTVWKDGNAKNHTYLLDGSNLVAYIKFGDKTPFYFKNPIKNFDKRGRSFIKGDKKLFAKVKSKPTTIEVQGSKGNTYYVDPDAKTCTCPGFTFRGACKHITELLK
jgi:hypothetical protein